MHKLEREIIEIHQFTKNELGQDEMKFHIGTCSFKLNIETDKVYRTNTFKGNVEIGKAKNMAQLVTVVGLHLEALDTKEFKNKS